MLFRSQYNLTFEVVCLLQPTSPLRDSRAIVKAIELMDQKQANVVVGVCEVDHSPLWANTLPEDGSLLGFLRPEVVSAPRQSLPTYFRINGAIYLVKTEYLSNSRNLYGGGCFAYVMDKRSSVDIDDDVDFAIAQALLGQPQ